MEAKFTKGEWKINSAFSQEVNTRNGVTIADCSKSIMIGNAEKEANAKLIASAPEMYNALAETDKDLCVLETTMRQIELTDKRAEGMVELVIKWRERNKQALKKATE